MRGGGHDSSSSAISSRTHSKFVLSISIASSSVSRYIPFDIGGAHRRSSSSRMSFAIDSAVSFLAFMFLLVLVFRLFRRERGEPRERFCAAAIPAGARLLDVRVELRSLVSRLLR